MRALAFALCLFTSQVASAEPTWIVQNNQTHNVQTLDLVGVLGWFGLGAGVHYALPLVTDGFLPKVNDSFDLELSGYLLYWYYGYGDFAGIAPLAGVRWKFHLTPEWTVFGLAKAGLLIGVNHSELVFVPQPGVGAYWHFTKGMEVRMDLTYLGLSGGLSIDM
jgi:hypothetical protein